ncbi:MAG TPA: hypothetical protein VF740_01940 [Candidatus Acidoferrum sp.]
MKFIRRFLGMFLWLSFASAASGQEIKAANPAAVPPNLLVFVHQEIQPGRTGERQKLEAALSRACNNLDAPSFWIDLQSLTGSRESLFFDLFDSFEHVQESHADWKQFYAAHPDLAKMQEEIDSLVSSERTIIAVRRDDLGYLAENIDLSDARFMRVIEVRLFPGHESDFVEAIKLWSQAHTKANAELPWVVYQVKDGTTAPSFLIFLPLSELKVNDDLAAQKWSILEAMEGDSADRLKQIAREAFISTESNLYAVSPELSHVPKEFAASDPDFWRQHVESETKPEPKPGPSPPKKKTPVKPSR